MSQVQCIEKFISSISINKESFINASKLNCGISNLELRDELPLGVTIFLGTLYIIAALLGTIGNVMAIITIALNKRMQIVGNLLLLNLTISDLLVTSICMPTVVAYQVFAYPNWPFSKISCIWSKYVVQLSVFCSVLTLIAIAVYRYFIVRGVIRVRSNPLKFWHFVIAYWVAAITYTIPTGLNTELVRLSDGKKVKNLCIELYSTRERERWQMGVRVSAYFVTVAILAVTYTCLALKVRKRKPADHDKEKDKERRTAIKLLVGASVAFMMCWLPYVIHILFAIWPPWNDYQLRDGFDIFGNFLGLFNSVLDPYLYCYFSKSFRRGFKNIATTMRHYMFGKQRNIVEPIQNEIQIGPVGIENIIHRNEQLNI